MLSRRGAVAGLIACGAAPGGASSAWAAVVDRQVRMAVGFAAGGGTDVSARIFAEHLRPDYSSTVIVENRTGAASRPAVEFVKNAAPDGATMLFTTDFPITLFPHIFRKLEYNPLTDLIPVAPVTKSALVVSVGPAVPASVTDVRGFIDWARAHPKEANFATTGSGGTPHFVGVMLANASHTPLTAVHYRGGAPALQDLMGGHVSMSVNPSSEAIPLAKGGAIRILAVASADRSRFLPDTPSLREQGFDVAINTWTGVFLPARTPAPIVDGLAAALAKLGKTPEVVDAQERLGNEMFSLPQPEFAALVKADIAKWGTDRASLRLRAGGLSPRVQ